MMSLLATVTSSDYRSDGADSTASCSTIPLCPLTSPANTYKNSYVSVHMPVRKTFQDLCN